MSRKPAGLTVGEPYAGWNQVGSWSQEGIMTATTIFQTIGESGRGCRTTADELQNNYTCKEKLGIFTPREQRVLARIREWKTRVRELKDRIAETRGTKADDSIPASLEEQLIELRKERALLEQERVSAAEERMRWLGHA